MFSPLKLPILHPSPERLHAGLGQLLSVACPTSALPLGLWLQVADKSGRTSDIDAFIRY